MTNTKWEIFKTAKEIPVPDMCVSVSEQNNKLILIYEKWKNDQVIVIIRVYFADCLMEGFRKFHTVNRNENFIDIPVNESWIFVSKDSEYLSWFKKQAIDDFDFKHYMFITDEEIIDILSTMPPIVVIENFKDNE